ncbi:type II secretion system protein N [Thalassotalea crassostreae]|uniref:type II secretion system protein N n=1 Tax=Thalassotalea crassostreae TaxID=1763536 RepID=UPI00083996B1|nr:type II secretion system protein N [Thalassotalea crassostreae]
MNIKAVKKYSAYSAAFIVLYLFFVVVSAPADKIISKIPLPKGVVLSGVTGSALSGNIAKIYLQNKTITDVDYSLSIMSLIMLDPKIEINLRDKVSGAVGKFSVSNLAEENVKITNVTIAAPASKVVPMLNLPIDLNAKGILNIKMDEFIVGKPICSNVVGTMVWQKALINPAGDDAELGDIKAALSCENGMVVAKIDPQNSLGLELTATVQSRTRVSAVGFLLPGQEFPATLKPMLDFMGRPDSQGRYNIRM